VEVHAAFVVDRAISAESSALLLPLFWITDHDHVRSRAFDCALQLSVHCDTTAQFSLTSSENVPRSLFKMPTDVTSPPVGLRPTFPLVTGAAPFSIAVRSRITVFSAAAAVSTRFYRTMFMTTAPPFVSCVTVARARVVAAASTAIRTAAT
jgi:hypothetical protein